MGGTRETGLFREQAGIDENLCRSELTAGQFSSYTRRRKATSMDKGVEPDKVSRRPVSMFGAAYQACVPSQRTSQTQLSNVVPAGLLRA